MKTKLRKMIKEKRGGVKEKERVREKERGREGERGMREREERKRR